MKVGIIGAGVGGLSLARNLQYFKNCGVASVKVYEKSAVLKPALGGSLGLHGGTVCLAKAGLGDKLVEIGNPMQRVYQYSSGQLLRKTDLSSMVNSAPYVASNGKTMLGTYMRSELQKMLADSLEPGTVVLAKDAVKFHVKPGPGGGVTVVFSDGTEEHFDLLVGADGIRSIVRQELFDYNAKPVFSGFRTLYAVAPRFERRDHSAVIQAFRPGGTSLLGSSGKNDVIGAFLWRTNEQHSFDWVHPYAKEDLVREFEKWRQYMPAEFLNEYETLCTTASRVFDWSIYYTPVLPKWHIEDKVLLLGDSCHATTPFVGQGANQAIADAYSIVDKLMRKENGEFPTVEAAFLNTKESGCLLRSALLSQVAYWAKLRLWIPSQ